ncbi:MAG TPA: hypothetical protein VLE47_00470 [Candidatus Saccharimonadales bacterium]|nr:hypothetical protein [Candidatus Saccharimonadales bacterium]
MKFNQVTWYSKLIALILFVALPFIGFYLGMQYQELTHPTTEVQTTTVSNSFTATTSANTTNDQSNISIKTDQVSVNAVEKNGLVTYSGTVQLPTPCTNLNVDATASRTDPSVVSIQLTTQPTDTVCAQVVTPKPFSGEVAAPKGVQIHVFYNGSQIK